MWRDARGRFAAAPALRRYRLRFDDAPDEFIDAPGPTEAVKCRTNRTLPRTMTDLTAMAAFARGSRPHSTPLLDRLWGATPGAYLGDPRMEVRS